MFALKVEKAMSDAQQESQFKDLLNQHLLPLSGINHDSSKKKKEFRAFIMLQSFPWPGYLAWTHL